jgi:hypothetical protein
MHTIPFLPIIYFWWLNVNVLYFVILKNLFDGLFVVINYMDLPMGGLLIIILINIDNNTQSQQNKSQTAENKSQTAEQHKKQQGYTTRYTTGNKTHYYIHYIHI